MITQETSAPRAALAALTETDDERALAFGDVTTTWVNHTRNINKEYKRALARYFVTHHMSYADGIMLGSGSTLNAVMDELIQFQIDQERGFDLKICTPNLQIFQKGRLTKASNQHLFANMQLTMTGGALLNAMESLAGDLAVQTINSDLFYPDTIIFGAAGVKFDQDDIRVAFQWQDELDVQTALATRPTRHRILMTDHAKLGRTGGWRADINMHRMMARCQECSIISTLPDEPGPVQDRIMEEVEAFRAILQRLAADECYARHEVRLILVDANTRIKKDVSLSVERKALLDLQKKNHHHPGLNGRVTVLRS